MESIFVSESPIDSNLFVNECNDLQKLKVGEIFQIKDNSLSMCCMQCLQEFQYFTEFSLHIQEHFLHGDIKPLCETREEDSMQSKDDRVHQIIDTKSDAEVINECNEVEIFTKDLDLLDGWSDDEFTDKNHRIFEPEINVESFEKLPETPIFAEGVDYEKINAKYQCKTCQHETARWEHFKDHLLTHSNVRNILCPICYKAFAAISYVRKHVNRTHKMKITADRIRESQPTSGAAIVEILTPIKTIETKSFVEGEDYEKANGRFKCLTCGRVMLEHIKEHLLTHSNEKDVFCPICEKPFIAVSYVRKHVNRAHKMKITAEEIKSAQSHKGGKHAQSNIAAVVLCQNKVEYPEKNFECFECHRQFTSLSSLRIHSKLHTGIRYACPHCEKIFAMRSYVRDHIVAMHGIKREEIPKDCIQQATEHVLTKPCENITIFKCNLCTNQYTKKQTFQQHMKTHTSGPYLCVICGVVYKSISNLRYHMERHQADPNKEYKCIDCGKMYPTRRYMLSHYRSIHLNKRKRKPKNELVSIEKDLLT